MNQPTPNPGPKKTPLLFRRLLARSAQKRDAAQADMEENLARTKNLHEEYGLLESLRGKLSREGKLNNADADKFLSLLRGHAGLSFLAQIRVSPIELKKTLMDPQYRPEVIAKITGTENRRAAARNGPDSLFGRIMQDFENEALLANKAQKRYDRLSKLPAVYRAGARIEEWIAGGRQIHRHEQAYHEVISPIWRELEQQGMLNEERAKKLVTTLAGMGMIEHGESGHALEFFTDTHTPEKFRRANKYLETIRARIFREKK